ncbi:MAG TPA: carboxypeptidase-like regulatory domain-containing protein, partial [Planctomycetaceae bacterium]|nr:carboxypeptidase-like regulatory domain-containing protein [Planctomycetaceae bacterium]
LLGSGQDARGFHVFVEPAAERLELNVRDYLQKWSPFETTIDVAGPDDRVVHVKADASKRWLALAGRVLNPDGRAVSNAKLRLYAWTDGKRDYHGNDSLRLWATTDDEGRFRFDVAPDRCFIELSHYSSEHAEKIRGWTPPVAVDRTTRDVTIQLQRGGRVKILLPAGIGTDADGLHLDRRDVPDNVPIRHQSLNFDRSPERRELLSPVLPPGKYHLKNYRSESAEVAAALGEAVLDIEAGQEIVLDLRDRKLPERRPSVRVAKAWQTITVRREGEAFSGAEVSVLESVALPEDLTRWIREATAAKTPEAREAAIAMLRNSGALAVDAIRAAGQSRQNEKLFEDLGEMRGDGFGPVLTDVSDEEGQIRCELIPGRQCVAVARVRGRFIGWKAFIAGEEAVTVDLQPARTLEVRWIQLLPMEKREKPEHAELRPAQPMDPGLRGLMSTLRYPYGMYFRELTREAIENGQYSLYPDADARWSLEDLPVGFAGELMLSRDFNEVEIPTYQRYRMLVVPGDGVQTMLCPQTEFDWAAFADRLATWWPNLRYW